MSKKFPNLEVFQDNGGEWRWHLIATNGEVVASSGESFDSQRNAIKAAGKAKGLMQLAQRVSVRTEVTA